jgi:hypothetical protein
VALADWVAELQIAVRRTRHRRRVAIATGSAAALMLTSVGVALATDRPGGDTARISAPLADPGAQRAAPERAHPIHRETPSRPGGLMLSAHAAGDVVAAGQQLGVVVRWRDGQGRLTGLGQDWGDGTAFAAPGTTGCTRGATQGSRTVWHSWRSPGRYTVRLSATTGSCGARAELRSVWFTVLVVAPGRRVIAAPGPDGPPPVSGTPTPRTAPAPSSPSAPPPSSPVPTAAPTGPGSPSATTPPPPEPEPTTPEPEPDPTESWSSPVTPEVSPTRPHH